MREGKRERGARGRGRTTLFEPGCFRKDEHVAKKSVGDLGGFNCAPVPVGAGREGVALGGPSAPGEESRNLCNLRVFRVPLSNPSEPPCRARRILAGELAERSTDAGPPRDMRDESAAVGRAGVLGVAAPSWSRVNPAAPKRRSGGEGRNRRTPLAG